MRIFPFNKSHGEAIAVRPRAESDELISFVVSTFQGSSEVEAIILDGSAATGETDAYSDADFSIFLSSTPDAHRSAELRHAIQPTIPIVLGHGIFRMRDVLVVGGVQKADICYYLAPAVETAVIGALRQPVPALALPS